MTDILATPKGRVIKGADGTDYILAPFNLNSIANIEQEFDCEIDDLLERLNTKAYTQLRKLLWVLLQENYPGIKLIDVGKLVEFNRTQVKAIFAEITAMFEELNK